MNPASKQVTQLLKRWDLGDDDAPARLIPLVYEELRELSRNYMRDQHSGGTPPNTTPVREAYLRMVDHGDVTQKDRAKFYGIAARLLRRILVEQGRTQDALRNRRRGQRNGANGWRDLPVKKGAALVAFNRALEAFEEIYPQKSQVVELKFFGGLNIKEISKVLGVSEETVLRDWSFAKLWLYRELHANAG